MSKILKTVEAAAASGKRPTKLMLVQSMLGRSDGASVAELAAATGWQNHTVRATLTRLRKDARIGKRQRDGVTCYIIQLTV